MSDALHSTYALLHDPLSFNYLKDGPPYLPGIVGGKVASLKGEARVLVQKVAQEMGGDIQQAFQHCMSDYGSPPMSELAVLLASLRAEAQIHQAHHWQTQGQSYYGDHLLFERVYGEVNGLVDGLAERAVGMGDAILVQPLLQMSHQVVFSKLFYSDAPVRPSSEEMPLLSLRALLKSAVLLQLAYKSLEARNLLSYGIDNLLQGIADKQESLIYLLKQRTKDGGSMPKTASSLEALTAFQRAVHARKVVAEFRQASRPGLPSFQEFEKQADYVIQAIEGWDNNEWDKVDRATGKISDLWDEMEEKFEGKGQPYIDAMWKKTYETAVDAITYTWEEVILNDEENERPEMARQNESDLAEFKRKVTYYKDPPTVTE